MNDEQFRKELAEKYQKLLGFGMPRTNDFDDELKAGVLSDMPVNWVRDLVETFAIHHWKPDIEFDEDNGIEVYIYDPKDKEFYDGEGVSILNAIIDALERGPIEDFADREKRSFK